jgi:hypothetical protein
MMEEAGKDLENNTLSEGGSSQPNDLSAFFKFPSLSRLFQDDDRLALREMQSKLTQTDQSLERVIRQGSKEDAEKAVLASRSFKLTLTLLEELEGRFLQAPK